MPEPPASYNAPDPARWTETPAARAALESAPRRESLPGYALASDAPLPPPWPPVPHDSVSGMASTEAERAQVAMCGPAEGDNPVAVEAQDDWDGEDDAGQSYAASDFSPRRAEDRATRPIFAPEQWVSDPDFWESKTHIAMTGRHPVPRPKSVSITPPQRFRPMPRWRSMLVLSLVCLLIAFIAIGGVELARLGTPVHGPTHHTATPAPTHTAVVPTATPTHKNKK